MLSGFIGARLTDGAVIVGQDSGGDCAGLVLRFEDGDLVIGTLGDEWVLSVGQVPSAAARYWAVQPFIHGGCR